MPSRSPRNSRSPASLADNYCLSQMASHGIIWAIWSNKDIDLFGMLNMLNPSITYKVTLSWVLGFIDLVYTIINSWYTVWVSFNQSVEFTVIVAEPNCTSRFRYQYTWRRQIVVLGLMMPFCSMYMANIHSHTTTEIRLTSRGVYASRFINCSTVFWKAHLDKDNTKSLQCYVFIDVEQTAYCSSFKVW